MGPFNDLESNLRRAVNSRDSTALADCVRYSETLASQPGGKPHVTRILWRVINEAPEDLADLVLSSLTSPFDFQFVDDINGRTCLHEAAKSGCDRLARMCIEHGVRVDKRDAYGRTALHYAALHGNSSTCKLLLEAQVPPDALDLDNYSPLVYATLCGSVECVKLLLDIGHVSVDPSSGAGDLIPLSLACRSGHIDVVTLLLE
ncbi:ankyrin, partial [Schizophyllum commune H4-8]|uniref:ankyrin n=1 Tax=Schizophyllum commune (strain H4-8 / FGSC 9210) TaxID=578458 RepID=UPI0021608282